MDFLNNIKRTYLYIFLFISSLCLYYNSTKNEYALDDDIVVRGNKPVQKGFAGIKEIFSTDMFASVLEDHKVKSENNILSGGRYRPLSIATFAIEQQFVGFNPFPKHWINIILYGILVMLIFHFILNSLKLDLFTAFLAAFIFAIHPIHTEVVANLKSRDEILSLIFYILTINYYLKYIDKKTTANLAKLILCFVAAILSKEYAITLLIVLPVAAYTLRGFSIGTSLKTIMGLGVTFVIYALIRGSVVGWSAPEQMDPLNNPYVYATGVEKIATKIYVLLKYVVLLFKPFPLCADYSYAQIRYRTFADWDVWLSVVINGAAIWYTVKAVLKRKMIGWLGVIYFANLFLISNFIFNIGASMGERFLFHSSFAFCIALALGCEELRLKIKAAVFDPAIRFLFVGITLASFLIVIPRNREWKNTYTLFLKDVETSPNSALCNANATVSLVNLALAPENSSRKDSLLRRAIVYSQRAAMIHPDFANAYFNWAVCEFDLANYDSAFVLWDKGFSKFDSSPHKERFAELVYNKALSEGHDKHFETAVKLLEWSVKIEPGKANYWSDLGGARYEVNRYEDAKAAWEKTLELDPANEQANKALPFIKQKLTETQKRN